MWVSGGMFPPGRIRTLAKGKLKMAKSTRDPQKLIPEQFRPQMKISDDGNTVFFTIGVARYERYQVQKKRTDAEGLEEVWIEIDRTKIAGASRAAEEFCYGEKRETYDGFQKDKVDDQTPTGIVAAALEWAENQRDWMYGIRSKQFKSGSAPKVVREAVKLLSESIIEQKRTDSGKRYTRKTLPDFVKDCKNLDEVKRAAEQFGVGETAYTSLIKMAEARAITIDLSL
jgi:hypothetical protein